ncbi:hypothetical protein XM38_048410 [Halomicronema hongdechloris C2206]|uniref:Uncharacterized protein n=1 Tax=Halomicronema hongdechloris C2206 TaxID=1641165 RepID=A0A1Z3HUR2_9CYAN|nr:hypothetical protein [Halomicronema hongdechloris]ASC73867.1 hypothetical protein XM38_048410 [Halomicronema hongdechloris C2206]
MPSFGDTVETEPTPRAPLYSPLTLALHTLAFGPFFGLVLYGLNLIRRGEGQKGNIFVVASLVLLVLSLVLVWVRFPALVILNGLVAVTLYQLETPHFDYALDHGGRAARWWWPTLIGLALLLLQGLIALSWG